MSAYVVEDNTINKIISYLAYENENFLWHLKESGYDLKISTGQQRLAIRMFALNVRAVNERYGHKEANKFRSLDFKFRVGIPPSPIEAYKALQCWLYQCTEGTVPDTKLYILMEKMHGRIAHQIVSKSPQYECARWG